MDFFFILFKRVIYIARERDREKVSISFRVWVITISRFIRPSAILYNFADRIKAGMKALAPRVFFDSQGGQ